MRRVLSVVLAAAALCGSAFTQDYARLRLGNQGLLAVWVGEQVVVVPESGGLLGGPLAKDSADYLEATYVATSGALIKVYVDCAKRTQDDCLRAFRVRYEELTKLLPIDKEATAKWLKIQ